jgi:hypothetical protein
MRMAKSPTLDEAKAPSLGESAAGETIWDSLKETIATSSGFKRWQTERHLDSQLLGLSFETLVLRYLRETLDTLAY